MLSRTLGISLTVLTQGTMQMFDSHEFMALFKQLIESDLDEDMQQMSRFHFQHPGSLTRARLTFNCSMAMQLPFDVDDISDMEEDEDQRNFSIFNVFGKVSPIKLTQAHELANSHLCQAQSMIHQIPQDMRLPFLQLYRPIQPRLIKDLA